MELERDRWLRVLGRSWGREVIRTQEILRGKSVIGREERDDKGGERIQLRGRLTNTEAN